MSAPPVDLDAFRDVMREAGIEEAVAPTLQVWVDEAPVKFSRLEAAVAAADPHAVASAAHALKSSCSHICATDLVAALHALESAGHAGERDGVAPLFSEVRPRYEAALAYVKAHI
jgi:HPt (histidine-containing phosphotransfer) domain-containing protein